jgi:SAM-dependent methyltransferase
MPAVAQYLPDAGSLAGDRGVDLELWQCSGCGLVQLNRDSVPYYREVLRAAGLSEAMGDFRRRQFARLVHDYSLAGKKAVEIGCGRGEYLRLIREAGLRAYGVEQSPDSVTHCVAQGLKVSQGFVAGRDCRLEHAPFDAFFLLNFLEHLPDPGGTLDGIHANLADDAIGLVEVPNFDMMLRERLFTEIMSDHLSYFTRDTLGTAMALSGFEMVECREERHGYLLSAVLRRRRRLDLAAFAGDRARLQSEVDAYLDGFGPRRVAVWSAGHQSLATIALLGLADKIRYVVDSAPYKQGKFTPATHVPIVSPEALAADPVDAVLVMAAGYSDEVAAIVRRDFGPRMAVAILRASRLEVLNQCPCTQST